MQKKSNLKQHKYRQNFVNYPTQMWHFKQFCVYLREYYASFGTLSGARWVN